MVKLVHAYGLQDVSLASLYTGNDVSLTAHSGRRAILEFASGYEIDIAGRDMRFNGLAITAGTLEKIVFRDPQGNTIATASDLKGFDASEIYDTVANQSGSDLHPLLFAGDDLIFGSDGNDLLQGYGADDKIKGNSGDDRLHGNNGADMLYGGTGKDTLDGGNGNDTLIGNGGGDTFVGGANSGHDTVRDFDATGSDHDWIMNEGSGDVTWAKQGDDLLLTFDSGDTMLLIGVKRWQFSEDYVVAETI